MGGDRVITTISDVARGAGVSMTTVSHVLNGKGRVSPRTRQRVLAIAEELGYEANLHARGLARGRSLIVAIQISGYGDDTLLPSSSYFQQLLNSASAAALQHGLALVVAPPGATTADLRRLPADGAIIVDPSGEESIRSVMVDRGAPVVTVGRIAGEAALQHDCVDNDHQGATVKVLEHLWDNGYRSPALITTGRPLSYALDAVAAYDSWTATHGARRHLYQVAETGVGAAERVVRRVLRGEDGPDAFYATTDDMAVGVLLGIRAVGREVPSCAGIVAGTDAPALRTAVPPVTALNLHPSRIGEEALRLLAARLNGLEAGPPQHVRVPSRLIPRGSTKRISRSA